MSKTYVLEARQIRALATDRGACIASDKITVQGEPVGYMYREPPVETSDSGWRFLSGTETDEYMNDPNNSGLFDVNTIANYDTDIIEFLDAPMGAAFVRQTLGAPLLPYVFELADGEPELSEAVPVAPEREPEPAALEPVAGARPGRSAPPARGAAQRPPEPTAPPPPPAPVAPPRSLPVRRDITLEWSMTIEPEFGGRLVDGDLEFVAPGPPVRTIWISVWSFPPEPDPDNSPEAVLAEFRAQANPAVLQTFDEPGEDVAERRFATWYPEYVEGGLQWSLYGYTVRPEGWVQSAFFADSAEQLDWALETWRSFRFQPQT